MSLAAFLNALAIAFVLIGGGLCLATWLGIRQTERRLRAAFPRKQSSSSTTPNQE